MNITHYTPINYNPKIYNQNFQRSPQTNEVNFNGCLGFDCFTRIFNHSKKKELTKNNIIQNFKECEALPFTNSTDCTKSKTYALLQKFGLDTVTKTIDSDIKGMNFIKGDLPVLSDVFLHFSKETESLTLFSSRTRHSLYIHTEGDKFIISKLQDKNFDLKLEKSIEELTDREFEILKNNLNFFKTFEEKTAEEESKNYLSLGKLNPRHKGIIYEKITQRDGSIKKVPTKVKIEKEDGNVFNFVKNGETIGYVILNYITEEDKPYIDFKEKNSSHNYEFEFLGKYKKDVLGKDYEKYGIKGDRIIVEFLTNNRESQYGGIGHLADLLEVACCKELGIKPNIISYSTKEAIPLHYKRGKRFIPFEMYNKDFTVLYGGADPNELAAKAIAEKDTHGKYNLKDLGGSFLMYMPEKLVEKYEKELEKNPIF